VGLDMVEYVMALEDAFELTIPNTAAELLSTPAQMIDYVCQRLGEVPDGAPLVQIAFHRLRAAVASELGVPRSSIRPETSMAVLAPSNRTDTFWPTVARRMHIEPSLLSHVPM
jgi:hypothetical protein